MARSIEGRLAKLEVSLGEADRLPVVIWAQNEEGETLEEFEKRLERLKREVPGYPNRLLVIYKWITKPFALEHPIKTGGRQ